MIVSKVVQFLTLALVFDNAAAFSASRIYSGSATSLKMENADAQEEPKPAEPAASSTSSTIPAASSTIPAASSTIQESTTSQDGVIIQGDSTAAVMELKSIGKKLNPIVGYFDPLGLSQREFWSSSNEATIGFLRHAEIKHGRVAMAAFVGYWVQSNWHWPWAMSLDGSPFPSIDLSPEAQWDAMPTNAKVQIFVVIALLEWWDEIGGNLLNEDTQNFPHYMKGRLPGKYPSFENFRKLVHWIPDLYDPGNLSKNMSEEKKAKGRITEINNGRLAMIGIMGFLAADKVPGAVPVLKGIAQSYDGNVMVPFSNDFSFFGP